MSVLVSYLSRNDCREIKVTRTPADLKWSGKVLKLQNDSLLEMQKHRVQWERRLTQISRNRYRSLAKFISYSAHFLPPSPPTLQFGWEKHPVFNPCYLGLTLQQAPAFHSNNFVSVFNLGVNTEVIPWHWVMVCTGSCVLLIEEEGTCSLDLAHTSCGALTSSCPLRLMKQSGLLTWQAWAPWIIAVSDSSSVLLWLISKGPSGNDFSSFITYDFIKWKLLLQR